MQTRLAYILAFTLFCICTLIPVMAGSGAGGGSWGGGGPSGITPVGTGYVRGNGSSVSYVTPIVAADGGTGLASYTAGDTMYWASGTAFTKVGIGAAGTISNSSGTAPQWSTKATLGIAASGANTDITSFATTGASTMALGSNVEGLRITSSGAGQTAALLNLYAPATQGANTYFIYCEETGSANRFSVTRSGTVNLGGSVSVLANGNATFPGTITTGALAFSVNGEGLRLPRGYTFLDSGTNQATGTGDTIFTADTTINHLVGGGTAPTIAANTTGLGASGTATISGTDLGGEITLNTVNTDTPAANTDLCTVTFGRTYTTAPTTIMVMPSNAAAQNLAYQVVRCQTADLTATTFKLKSSPAVALPALTTAAYKLTYVVIK